MSARDVIANTLLPIADSFAQDPPAVASRWADESLAALHAAGYIVIEEERWERYRVLATSLAHMQHRAAWFRVADTTP